ncbi:MAG: hypothetical protein PHV06_09915, partial [bacterium]|nr:hypothetical protein [bacterium]
PYPVFTRLFFPISLRIFKFLYGYLKSRRPIAFLRNLIKVIRFLPKMLEKRKVILKTRLSTDREMLKILKDFDQFMPDFRKIKSISGKVNKNTQK